MDKNSVRSKKRKRGKHAKTNVKAVKGEKGGDIGPPFPLGLDSVHGEPGPQGTPDTTVEKEENISTGTMGKKNVRGKRGKRDKHANPDVVAERELPGKLGPTDEIEGQGVLAEKGEKENDEMYSPKGDIGRRGPSTLDIAHGEPVPQGPPVHDIQLFTTFYERENTFKLQHVVEQGGQKVLDLITKSLLLGKIQDIVSILRKILGSNTQYKNSFTAEEQRKLLTEDHTSWDVNLHFEIIQKACGLAEAGSNSWTHVVNDNETLEYLIMELKKMRNSVMHKFDRDITADQLEEHLNDLQQLAAKMIVALEIRAAKLGKHFPKEEASETLVIVGEIIADVK